MLIYQDFKYIWKHQLFSDKHTKEIWSTKEGKALSYPSAINFLRLYVKHDRSQFFIKIQNNAHNYITITQSKELPNRTLSQRYEAIPKAI